MPEEIIKLLLAILIGGLIGAEREFRDKAAGFRTIMLICVGATLFTMLSIRLGGAEDPVRIAASVVSGVGFLGAGAILRDRGHVVGLTTAATIWLAAALGMGIGGGHFYLSSFGAGIILIVLLVFPKIEAWIDNIQETRTYRVISLIDRQKFIELETIFQQCSLRVRSRKQLKRGDEMICIWVAVGSPQNHEQVVDKLFADAEIKEFEF